MPTPEQLSFPPFRLDLHNQQLWQGTEAVSLRPKTFAVLRYLVEHAGQLVTKEELLDALWPQTYGREALLKRRIYELRQVLRDASTAPRFIETAGRRGYRWIAPFHPGPDVRTGRHGDTETFSPSPRLRVTASPSPSFVGRDPELARLHQLYAKALSGERQVVFVTGEAGIGKTALIETFLAQVGRADTETRRHGDTESKEQSPRPPAPLTPSSPLIGRGQCVEHYGAGEAYMPMLEALGRLCCQPEGKQIIDVLRRIAPTWLAQLSAVLSAAETLALQQQVAGLTRERMLREMAEALESLTDGGAYAPLLILVLEDLHWCDVSTIELLALLARRREPARLFFLGTYRPAEVVVSNHPLKAMKQELVARRQGVEVLLENLPAAAVRTYVSHRFPATPDEPSLAAFVYRRTEGHPLFMVQVADYLTQSATAEGSASVAAGALDAVVPQGLRELIEVQLERLPVAARRVLEVASVAGAEFVVASVAAGAQVPAEEVERQCAELAGQGQFIEERGLATWPDGTVSGRYGFRHALYEEVLSYRLSAGQRVRLQRAIGTREEAGYGERSKEIAAELALRFERGQEYQKAVEYHQQAAKTAVRRAAYREAIARFHKALALLQPLPDTPERSQQELTLHVALGAVLAVAKGFADSETAGVYRRARVLCEQIGDTPELVPVLGGLCRVHFGQGDFPTARAIGEQMLGLAQRLAIPAALVEARYFLGTVLVFQGEVVSAHECLQQAITLSDPLPDCPPNLRLGLMGFAVGCRISAGYAWWMLGYPDRATATKEAALTLAQHASRPSHLAAALAFSLMFDHLRRDGPGVQAQAEATLALTDKHELAAWRAVGTILHGWARAEQGYAEEGITQIREGLAAFQATGAELHKAYHLALLAEAYQKVGQVKEGLTVLAEALTVVQQSGERWYEAELYRLRGELMLGQVHVVSTKCKVQSPKSKVQSPKSKVSSPQSAIHNPQWAEAEECFHQAIAIARQQEAKLFELRATVSLARFWQQQGKQKEAHQMLAEVYGWFTEGFETKDLQEAHRLLIELAARND